jgi:putative phage-type endonuclease
MTTTLEPRRICAADTPEWKEARNKGIGASEAAAACGVSEWQSPLELYYRKRGELPPIEENFQMRFGKFAEPFIEREFEKQTGLRILERQPGLFAHPDYPHVLASPDDVIDCDTGLELKTIGTHRASEVLGEQYTDEVPLEWNTQAQQQMLVMGFQTVWFAVLVGGYDLRVYEVQRHERAIQRIQKKVTDLWQRIQTGNPPDMESHPNNLEMVRELFGEVKTGSVIDLSAEAAHAWLEFENRRSVIKDWCEQQDQLKARVLFEIGDNHAGRLPDGRYVRRAVIRKAEYTVPAQEYIEARAVKNLK